MKVLMLGWELPPHNSGGLGVACYQLCKALSKKNVDIEFVLPYTMPNSIDFMKVTAAHPQDVEAIIRAGMIYDSYKYIYKDGTEKWLSIFDQQQLYEHAVGQIARGRTFDVIHAHDWLTFRAGIRAKQVSGKPLIVHVHSIESDRSGVPYGGNPLVREIEELGLLMADQIIAVSQLTKNSIVKEYGIPSDKISVVHNSIDRYELPELDPNNAYRFLSSMKAQGYKVVTNVGRLTIQKGLPNMLRAAREVVLKLPKTYFLIVGSGEQYHELIYQAAELGIQKNVIFTGFQRGKEWRDAFAVTDLFVMPSVSEPFGLTPLEALHYGAPSLISYQSGVSEVLRNCLKVDYWDIIEMANQICGALQSDSLRDELVLHASQELEHLNWDNSVEKISHLYNKHTNNTYVEASV